MTEGIMAHAMTHYAAISACSMGGICIPAMRSHTFIFKSLISVVKRAGSKSWHDISSWNEMPLCSSGRPHAFVLLSARARRTRRWTSSASTQPPAPATGSAGLQPPAPEPAGRIGAKQLRWMRALPESEARGDVRPRAEMCGGSF